jgi:hypothetical protein
MLGTILIVILVLALLGALPTWSKRSCGTPVRFNHSIEDQHEQLQIRTRA